MKKRDWAFVAACVSGALLFGVWSFQMGRAFHRSQESATDLSSLGRGSAAASSPARIQTDDGDEQARQQR